MLKKDCFYLGTVVAKYSFRGELLIKLYTDEPEYYSNLTYVFLEQGNALVPFFIVSCKSHKTQLLRVQFENILTESEAETFLKKNVYLPLSDLPKLKGNRFYFHEIIGFEVYDYSAGRIGIIKKINDQASQALLIIEQKGVEIMVPIVDEFIKKLDRQNRQLFIKIPDGLLDLNMS